MTLFFGTVLIVGGMFLLAAFWCCWSEDAEQLENVRLERNQLESRLEAANESAEQHRLNAARLYAEKHRLEQEVKRLKAEVQEWQVAAMPTTETRPYGPHVWVNYN